MSRYRFGPFLLDVGSGRCSRDGVEIPLQPLAFELLRLLVEAPGVLHTRDALNARLWPGVTVTENSLDQLVSRLRKALLPERYLFTVPRRGYRFEAEVVADEARPPSGAGEGSGAAVASGGVRGVPGFVGRTDDLGRLRAAIRGGARVLTLTGPGGVGKTSLAAQLAVELGRPAWLVDLSACYTADGVARAVARSIGIPVDGDPMVAVGRALARRAGLLVLDNFEQVVDAAPHTVGRWAAEAPDLVLVVTSRVVPGLRDHTVVPIEPLPQADAVALLAERAGVDPSDPDLVRLVEALDGLPLAIELAARRARTLGPAAVLARLHDRSLLADPRGDRPARHRSLDAALETSWELLGASEREALCRLAAFVGPFDLAAVEAVVDGPAADALQSLVEASLVRVEDGRFGVLSTIRSFVRARDPEARERADRRHGAYVAREGAATDTLDEAVVACERAVARGDAAVAARTAFAVLDVVVRTGPISLAIEALEGALSIDDGAHTVLLHAELGKALANERPSEALRHLEEAMRRAREARDDRRVGILLLDRAVVLRKLGDMDPAEEALLDALELLRIVGDRYHEGLALVRLGALRGRRNAPQDACRLCEEALAVFRSIDDEEGIAVATVNLANELHAMGDFEAAEARYREAVAWYVRRGHRAREANARGNLAVLLVRAGRLDEAFAEQQQAAQLATGLGAWDEVLQLCNLAGLYLERGEPAEAAPLLSRALARARPSGHLEAEAHVLVTMARLHRERDELHAADRLLGEAFDLLEGTGDARFVATAELERAALAMARGDAVGARAALARARALSDDGRALDAGGSRSLARLEARALAGAR